MAIIVALSVIFGCASIIIKEKRHQRSSVILVWQLSASSVHRNTASVAKPGVADNDNNVYQLCGQLANGIIVWRPSSASLAAGWPWLISMTWKYRSQWLSAKLYQCVYYCINGCGRNIVEKRQYCISQWQYVYPICVSAVATIVSA